MFKNLNLFQTAASMARHAAHRQAVSARNIANADTPGYRTQHVRPFSDSVGNTDAMQASRPAHFGASPQFSGTIQRSSQDFRDPNGNSVSVEEQMVSSVNAARDHEKALAIYRHGLTILRASLGRR